MRYLLILLCFLFSAASHTLTLKPDLPPRYVVQHGDNLWSIASRYLKNPWEWNALWKANPNIKNPNHLYPGAVLVMDYFQNKPYIRVSSNGTVKLSPSARATSLNKAIQSIHLDDIKPFLNESLILDEDVLIHAPYVVALMGERMLGGQGDEIHVKGLHPSRKLPKGGTIVYSLFRSGKSYIDPRTRELLGYKATLVGQGELVAGGEPATVILTNINAGIQKLDKVLINNSPEFDFYFEPKTPACPVLGSIIEMPDNMFAGKNQTAVGSVIIINIGANAGLEAGDVLGIYKRRRAVPDPKNHLVSIKLPPERIGEAMVFRTFTKTSFALIVRSTRAVYLMDTVTNP